MLITPEEVKKIARLARIKLAPEEEKQQAEVMSAVLDYMKILNEVGTNGVEATAQVTGLADIVREDVARDCPHKKELLEQMPELEMGELKVPAVFENTDTTDNIDG